MSPLLLHFPPFRLDPHNERLWRETVEIPLRPKTFAVLRYLVEHPEQLVTKEELLNAVWGETVVGEDALTGCIRDLRKILGDEAKQPRYIETVHRRGFRFIAEVVSQEEVSSQHPEVSREAPSVNGQEDAAVMPAKPIPGSDKGAGIQAAPPEATSDSPWIPASAGMTPLLFSPRNDVHGEQEPVHSLDEATHSPRAIPALESQTPPRSIRAIGLLFVGFGLLLGIIFAVRYFPFSIFYSEPPTPNSQTLPLPDKPSLIVLPLVNLSGDPEQEYFSDGLTEVLTGALSRISSLFIIARNSAFTYKGKAIKVQDVGREMGVRYVLEGSVQKANQRVRVAVQLIDATTGYHVWSEQYDRPLTDLFALQDEIVQKIVTTLKLQLTLQEHGYGAHKHTDNLEAYDVFLRGLESFNRFTKEANGQARELFEKAVALDPQYAEAYAYLSWSYYREGVFRWSADPQALERALARAQQAMALDDSLPIAHTSLSLVYEVTQQYDQATVEGERAIALDPNNADSYAWQAEALHFAGRPEEALQAVKQGMRLNPHYPPLYLFELGINYRATGRYAEAIATLKEAISRNPNLIAAHLNLAMSYWLQWAAQQNPDGQTLKEALDAVQRALTLSDWQFNHTVLGYIYLSQRQYDQALTEMERAVTLGPTEAWSYASLAEVLSRVGRTEEALEAAAQALRLKPFVADSHLAGIGSVYTIARHYEEAREPLQRFLSRYPNFLPSHLMLAAVYIELGQNTEARKEAAEVLRLNPDFSLEVYKQREPIKDPMVLEQHIAALRKAGLR